MHITLSRAVISLFTSRYRSSYVNPILPLKVGLDYVMQNWKMETFKNHWSPRLQLLCFHVRFIVFNNAMFMELIFFLEFVLFYLVFYQFVHFGLSHSASRFLNFFLGFSCVTPLIFFFLSPPPRRRHLS